MKTKAERQYGEHQTPQGEDDDIVNAITTIVREADAHFERVGGSSRHWVRDCFLPTLNAAGWAVSANDSAILHLERDLRESLRSGYLFGNFDEPLGGHGLRIVRVIQQRLSDLPCECTDRTPDGARCRACGGRL